MDDQKTPHDAQAGNEEKTDDTPFARHLNELDDQDTINPDVDESTGSDHIDDVAASLSDDVVQGIFQNEAWWDAQVDSDSPTCCLDGSPPSELASPRDKEPDTYAALLHKQVDNFELLEILGRGGMGVVFRARQLALDRIVCLKMMRLPELANAAEYKRFHAETLAIARLQHPNIVGIHGVGRYQNAPYYSMDYVEGVTLSKVISETPLRAAQAARYLMVIAEAIAYAHKNGIIHRDLKPSNVIIDTLGIPKITDFGIAKHLGAAEDLTTTGQLLGTPPYMSPEQASARDSDVGPSTDVYSLGAILYALLTGRPPHRGDTLIATIKLVQEEPPIAPRVLNRDIPVDLETICLTCLEKAPSARYASVEALAADLRRFLRDEPIEARRPSWLARGWRQIRRHPTVSVLTLACLSLVLLAGAGLVAFSVKQAFWNQEQTELIAALNASLARSLRSEREAQDLRYTSEMKFASQLISNGDYRGAAELLKPYVPEGDDFDFRGLEWYVFQQRAMPAEHANANLEQALFFLTMSIDGRWLAAAGCGDSVFLLNPQTCVVEQRIDTDQLEVNGVGLSSDGGRMGTAGDDGTIKVWSLENRQLLFSISAHDGPAFYAAFIKDDTQIVSCGMDTSLKVWDAANGDLLAELQGHTSQVEAFAISPDGDYLYSISEDDTGAIFNLDSRQLICAQEDTPEAANRRCLLSGWKTCRNRSLKSHIADQEPRREDLNHNRLGPTGPIGGVLSRWKLCRCG